MLAFKKYSNLFDKTTKIKFLYLGGLAGLSAALEALNAGSKIILLDKEKDLGGNSAKASSGELIILKKRGLEYFY